MFIKDDSIDPLKELADSETLKQQNILARKLQEGVHIDVEPVMSQPPTFLKGFQLIDVTNLNTYPSRKDISDKKGVLLSVMMSNQYCLDCEPLWRETADIGRGTPDIDSAGWWLATTGNYS